MPNVVSLQAVREARVPHWTGPALCMVCGHHWVASAPEGTTWLECPQCGCGNFLFQVTPEGIYCPRCGVWAEGV